MNSNVSSFPLVFDLQMVGGQAEMGMIKPGPFGTFSHASRLAGPDDRFVSIKAYGRVTGALRPKPR